MRDALLNETLLRSLPHARAVLEVWRRDYNEQQPHSKLGLMTPKDYASALSAETGDRAAQCSLKAPSGRLLPYTSTKAQITIGLSRLDQRLESWDMSSQKPVQSYSFERRPWQQSSGAHSEVTHRSGAKS